MRVAVIAGHGPARERRVRRRHAARARQHAPPPARAPAATPGRNHAS